MKNALKIFFSTEKIEKKFFFSSFKKRFEKVLEMEFFGNYVSELKKVNQKVLPDVSFFTPTEIKPFKTNEWMKIATILDIIVSFKGKERDALFLNENYVKGGYILTTGVDMSLIEHNSLYQKVLKANREKALFNKFLSDEKEREIRHSDCRNK